MTKIDIFSGFLGAGKTTLIKKLIKEAYAGQKIVLIENEFGEIGIDGGFMKEAGVVVNELNSGCICCSLTGDFREALKEVIERFEPDRILIEPSGVGKLSDVITAVLSVEGIQLNGLTTVADANKAKMYIKNFGEFFTNQVEYAACIILSRTHDISEAKLETCLELIRQYNKDATIITTDWDLLDGNQILSAIERKDTLSAELQTLLAQTDFDIDEDDDDDDDDDDEDDDDEYDEYDDDEYDDEHRSFGHHLLGILKVILALIIALLVVIVVLNFLHMGGKTTLVDKLHDKMGDSALYSILFPSYQMRANQIAAEAPVEIAEELPVVEEEPAVEEIVEAEPAAEVPVLENAEEPEAAEIPILSSEEASAGTEDNVG